MRRMTLSAVTNEKRTRLTTKEAAAFLRLSPRTLEGLRSKGGGPRFHKLGRGMRTRVLYYLDDLLEWMGTGHTATSEYAR